MKDKTSVAVSQSLEKMREAEYAAACTDFLTPAERAEVYAELVRCGGAENCFFWGGCVGCERCAAVFLPEWYLPKGAPAHKLPLDVERTAAFAKFLTENPHIAAELPLCALRVKGSGFKSLSHRDFMGGILSLGVDRSVIGDIAVVSECEALVFVCERIKNYLLDSLCKIGRDGVKTEEITLSPDFVLPRAYETFEALVASPRLDSVVKAVTGKSRETAAEMVREGLAELNYRQNDNVSAEVREGDILSVRGYGKFLIGEAAGQTKSGRLRLKVRKYI